MKIRLCGDRTAVSLSECIVDWNPGYQLRLVSHGLRLSRVFGLRRVFRLRRGFRLHRVLRGLPVLISAAAAKVKFHLAADQLERG